MIKGLSQRLLARTLKGAGLCLIVALAAGASGVDYDFGELQRRGCRLRQMAIGVGRLMDRFVRQRTQDPAGFDSRHGRLGAVLAQGSVPRGLGPFPRGPLVYRFVPTIGTQVVYVRPRSR